jgi:hypothetical protein
MSWRKLFLEAASSFLVNIGKAFLETIFTYHKGGEAIWQGCLIDFDESREDGQKFSVWKADIDVVGLAIIRPDAEHHQIVRGSQRHLKRVDLFVNSCPLRNIHRFPRKNRHAPSDLKSCGR